MIRIAVVDDHAMVRAGLRALFAEQMDFRVVAEGADGREAIAIVRDLVTDPAPGAGLDVLLLDIAMPVLSGVDALPTIRARAPALPVLIYSGFADTQYATTLLRLGAAGYLNKDCAPLEIVLAIRTVCRGRKYISAGVAECLAEALAHGLDRDADRPPHEQLSERELQVFLRLAQGETVGQLASGLSLSVKTVSTYRSRVMDKLHLASNSDLTYYALKNQLIR